MISLENIIWVVVAYLIGSIPTGYIVAERIRGIDIREHGSGNIGATNVFRIVGKGWGTAVLVLDILKGWIVTAMIAPTSGAFTQLSPVLRQFLFGAAVIAGHMWTPWLQLKGGKGIATSCGALFGIFPLAAIIASLIWTACFFIWRYVSLASIVAAGTFPLLLIIFHRHNQPFVAVFLISLALAALLIYNHRANIERLRHGKEPRVPLFKSKTPPPAPSAD